MAWSRQVAKVAFIPGHLIVPGVILFVFMGAWLGGASLGDWITCFVMGVVGFIMKRGGWPRPPLVLALILGSIMENSFLIAMNAHDGAGWLTRPIVLIIIVLIVLTIFFAARSLYRNRDAQKVAGTGEGAERNPILSLPFGIGLFLLFVWAGIEAMQWPGSVALFPQVAAVPGALLVLFAVINDFRGCRAATASHGGWAGALREASSKAVLPGAARFFGYLLGMILIMLVVGQKFAIPIFIAAYLIRWGKYNWRLALGYAVAGWVFLVGFYDRIMSLFWYPSWLDSWLPELLPDWLPAWLFV